MQKPTGQSWKNWKKSRFRQRIREGLQGNPESWEEEWYSHGSVQSYSRFTNREQEVFLDAEEESRVLRIELEQAKKQLLSEASVRSVIFGLSNAPVNPPCWLSGASNGRMAGVPTLFLSDLHWGEVVNSDEIGGVNEYDLEIAHQRLERCISTATSLLKDYFRDAQYPGIVLALGGDMLSGDIHEELRIHNAASSMQCLIDLRDSMITAISKLASEFGHVFVPCVAGNHGRLDKKPISKGRSYSNWDWLLYCLLEKAFVGDKRVHIVPANGPDYLYRIYGTRYCLTHGDQFRGGDGMIGHLGPLVRGDHKKRSRNNQINSGYDVLLCGHFHTLMMGNRFITNGSMIGYNEYAYQGNFGYEPARQALWITHKDHGIVWSMPVNLQDDPRRQGDEWVSVFR